MCFAIPGQINEIHAKNGVKTGWVSFGGKAVKEICLEYVPNAKTGDFIIAHKNFAIKKLNKNEVEEMLQITAACSH